MRQTIVLVVGFGAVLVGAPALAQDNPACAKFEEPLAYNACLARLGPHAPESKGIAAPDEGDGAPGAYGRRSAHGGMQAPRARRGRPRLEFNFGPKRDADVE